LIAFSISKQAFDVHELGMSFALQDACLHAGCRILRKDDFLSTSEAEMISFLDASKY
jgi:hypothetical protein